MYNITIECECEYCNKFIVVTRSDIKEERGNVIVYKCPKCGRISKFKRGDEHAYKKSNK